MRVVFPDKHERSVLSSILKKYLPLTFLFSSCCLPVLSFLLKYILLASKGLLEWLALSKTTISQGHIWQMFTYPFVASNDFSLTSPASLEITHRFLLHNGVCFLLLRFLLERVTNKLGAKRIAAFCILQIGIIGAIIWSIITLTASTEYFWGIESLLCSLATVHIFLDPDYHLFLPIVPISLPRKWFYPIVIGAIFCVSLYQHMFLQLAGMTSSVVLAALFCHQTQLPNPYLRSFMF